MQLTDLLNKPINELTDDELKQRHALIAKLKITNKAAGGTGSKPKKVKSNATKRSENLIKNFTPEQLKMLGALLQEQEQGK